MNKFRVGQIIRCVKQWGGTLLPGEDYEVLDISGDCVRVDCGIGVYFVPEMFEAIPGHCTCQDKPQWCEFCLAHIRYQKKARQNSSKPVACVPDDQPDKDLYDWHARAARKKAMATPVRSNVVYKPRDMRGDGIGRAVQNLTLHEPRLGASRFQP